MSAKSNIESYLRHNKDSWHFSAQLTRMEIENGDGTYADPKSISNRLQELQRESAIFVRYEGAKRLAKYRWIPPEWRKKYIPTHTHGVDGAWAKPQEYQVPSGSTQGTHTVRALTGGAYSCTCEGYRYGRKCRHIEQVKGGTVAV